MNRTVLLLAVLSLVSGMAHASGGWVASPVTRSLPGQDDGGKTWFDKSFGRRTGAFNTLDDSMNPGRKASGTFLVGRFRYTYKKPIGGGGYQPRHDESVDEVLLDCNSHASGTLSTTYKLRGKTVGHTVAADADVSLMPTGRESTVGDLCEFARAQGAFPIR